MASIIPPFIGAGILPYTISEKDGETYYLLAQAICSDYKDSEKWSDAGGRPKVGETPLECAVRECLEELGPILGNDITLTEWLQNHPPLTVIKENRLPYHLYLFPIDSPHVKLSSHETAGCSCITCSFTPTEEKQAIRFVPATALFEAVLEKSDVKINGMVISLLDAFRSEIEVFPKYLEWREEAVKWVKKTAGRKGRH